MSPTTPHPPSLEVRIREIYDALTDNETRLADVILAAPGEVATHTAAELSALAGISPATTTRFFRRLGYTSHEMARRQARDAQRAGSPLYLHRLQPKATEMDKLVQAHLENEAANLANSYRALDLKALPVIARKMAGARRLAFLGYRHSQPIAASMYRNLIEVRGDLHLLPAPGDTLAEWLGHYGPQDMVVCIGLRRRVPQLASAMEALAGMGVPMLYISDVMVGKPGKFAKWIIRCHTQGLMMFDSNAAVSAITNLLYSMVAKEIADSRSSHLEKVELMHEVLGELE
ncbi:RpiR family transcriptional regulator [Rhodoferax koreense]|uniref:RpiR family transcriptional regulator n=1 Tax=Rhodoferax koreensis TaxID=1842727 RepID=A0A1P8K0T9_9BURK|nr:MurR/RpiR family transcriptional regulator [Rhodoferax koreense]APW39616.1 RpiR family transcriptional regulator [Rhodoferax koreense]